MSLTNLLFWEKYRPKSLKQLILLPRISKFLSKGLQTNVIFYGTSGTGKSTLARILIKDLNAYVLNTSLENSIELLRTEIKDHCTSLSFQYKKDTLKVVYLDEFERASAEMQDALKAFIETYSDRVRFILTTNHIRKINSELKSRFDEINFDPINLEEVNYLKSNYITYLKAVCKIELPEAVENKQFLTKVIDKKFPDLRKGVQLIQQVVLSDNDLSIVDNSASIHELEIYDFLLDGKNIIMENFDIIMDNYQDKIDDIFQILGRPLFQYLRKLDENIIISKGAQLIRCSKQYNETLNNTLDPILHLIDYITEIKVILNK